MICAVSPGGSLSTGVCAAPVSAVRLINLGGNVARGDTQSHNSTHMRAHAHTHTNSIQTNSNLHTHVTHIHEPK